jgi:hypothetical protein
MELEDTKNEREQKKERKPYNTPQLVKHGAIEEITGQRNGISGFDDGDFDDASA